MPPIGKGKGIDVNSALTDDLTIHQNVQQELVVTTTDKMKICLMEHRDYLVASKEWIPMLGLTLSLLATLVAAEFTDRYLKASVWEALYLIAGTAAALYTGVLVVRALRGRKEGSVENLIDRISNRSKTDAVEALAAAALYARYAERSRRQAIPRGPDRGGAG